MNKIYMNIATVCGVGYWPKAPGTWGSLVSLPLAIILLILGGWQALVITMGLVFFIGWAASYMVLKDDYVSRDPSFVVIDEVVGQWIPLVVCGFDVRLWVLAFVLFRVFDIFKPYPIKKVEEFFKESGQAGQSFGIMVDDVIAGAYALGIVWGIVLLLGISNLLN